MRIGLREQLGLLVLASSLIGLGIVAIATWTTNHAYVHQISTFSLSLSASLKATQLAAHLALMDTSVRSLTTRVRLHQALIEYYSGVANEEDLSLAQRDLITSLTAFEPPVSTVQAVVWFRPGPDSGIAKAMLNITGDGPSRDTVLPYTHPNGSNVLLGTPCLGYPPTLYPTITYSQGEAHYNGKTINAASGILLGPYQLNESFALVSITRTITSLNATSQVLGFMTVVLSAAPMFEVLQSPIGLGEAGTILLIGPDTSDNLFPGRSVYDKTPATKRPAPPVEETFVRFVLPPHEKYDLPRHSTSLSRTSFSMTTYPAAWQSLTGDEHEVYNAGANLQTHDENGHDVSVGYAIPSFYLTDWCLLQEESRSEVWQPIDKLRSVLLCCVLGTASGMFFLAWPVAHFFTRPVRRLTEALSVREIVPNPPCSRPCPLVREDEYKQPLRSKDSGNSDDGGNESCFTDEYQGSTQNAMHQQFRVPTKVRFDDYWITDELTDLGMTLNEMSDEIYQQYSLLEQRVAERTAELELNKQSAESANEAKSLFIGNISHELKTPLNGILGMCAVCMQEEDVSKIKQALNIIYQSGDLLHNLLTDLLTFTKNEVDRQLSLEQRKFCLVDVSTQLLAIFSKQAKDGQVEFSIQYKGPKDLSLWGDQHRLLQVLINLISNSLKFTSPSGFVRLHIRCMGEDGGTELQMAESASSTADSTESEAPASKKDHTSKSGVRQLKQKPAPGTHVSRKPPDLKLIQSLQYSSRHETSEAPISARRVWYEFEVADNGIGIPEHLQQRIFDPFVQGDNKLNKKAAGTGLGLSICAQLAKLMEGEITLRSEPGDGSKFILRIPLRQDGSVAELERITWMDLSSFPRMTEHPTSFEAVDALGDRRSSLTGPVPNEAGSRLVGLSQPFFLAPEKPLVSPVDSDTTPEATTRILVAEDNKVNQEVVLRMLRLEGVSDVHVANDGQEALDMVVDSMHGSREYELVLMDVQMPNLDGRQSTRAIREAGFKGAIVALTAFSDEVNQKECMEAGMDYFMPKPIRRPALRDMLRAYCRKRVEGGMDDGLVGGNGV